MDLRVESETLTPTLESLRADVSQGLLAARLPDGQGQASDRPAASAAEEENREAADSPADSSDTALPQTPQPEDYARLPSAKSPISSTRMWTRFLPRLSRC